MTKKRPRLPKCLKLPCNKQGAIFFHVRDNSLQIWAHAGYYTNLSDLKKLRNWIDRAIARLEHVKNEAKIKKDKQNGK